MLLPLAGEVEAISAAVPSDKLRGPGGVGPPGDEEAAGGGGGVVQGPGLPEGRALLPALVGEAVAGGGVADQHGAPHPGDGGGVHGPGQVGEGAGPLHPGDPQLRRHVGVAAAHHQQPWGQILH